MRYLTSSFAAGAVRRGHGISQLLAAFEENGRRGLRYACIWPASRFERIRVRVYEVEEDLVSSSPLIDHFSGFYPEDEVDLGFDDPDCAPADLGVLDPYRRDAFGGRTVAQSDSPEDALEVAERKLGAQRNKWVNSSVLADEYGDYIQRGRPLGPWRSE